MLSFLTSSDRLKEKNEGLAMWAATEIVGAGLAAAGIFKLITKVAKQGGDFIKNLLSEVNEVKAASVPKNMAQQGLARPSGGGTAANQQGLKFENFLKNELKGSEGFYAKSPTAGAQFDGKYINSAGKEVWYEAKSGTPWASQNSYLEFQRQIGQESSIVKSYGKEFEVHFQVEPPNNVVNWLNRKNISFRIWNP
jgi:hypothetical protein